MNFINKKLSMTLGIVAMFFVFSVASAQNEYTPLVPTLPVVQQGEDATNLNNYLPGVFRLSIGIAAVLAFVMITFGGIMYATSDAISGKSQGREYVTNAIWGLLLVLGAYAILYTINPQMLNINLSIQRPNVQTPPATVSADNPGGTITIDGRTDWSCDVCVPITGVPLKAGQGTMISPTMLTRLQNMQAILTRNGISWEVTEAYPPTTSHSNACHGNGTCVDANPRSSTSPDTIRRFIDAAKAAGLKPIYEVRTTGERDALLKAGIRSPYIDYRPSINASHFSLYQ